jgi:L-lactate dehydrogenase complex protein LldG
MVGQPMSTAKEQILARVREAIGTREPAAPIDREYRQSLPVNLDQFEERLQDYNAVVYRCKESDIKRTVGYALDARHKTKILVPPDLPLNWLPLHIEFIHDEGLTHAELDVMPGVLTACTAAISLTGSIILSHSGKEGRRALTLIPDYHLCVVFASQVVETVPEAIRSLPRNRPVTTIAGPSATADIEMTRIKGVHGPRTLDVILVS